MRKAKRILKVPRESFIRNKLRKETKLLVEEQNLLPPVSFINLEKLAIQLLQKIEISEDYIDFTIVLFVFSNN